MLENNLHPDVAENPAELIVYGGIGKAARNQACLAAIKRELMQLADDQTLLVQSGKPVAVFETHEQAPRVLIANSNLVGEWANWETFRKLDAAGLMMYGQMTAGSWIYIGSQGILQGTYETFAAAGAQALRRRPERTPGGDRGARRYGRRAAARDHDVRRHGAVHRDRPAADRAADRRPATWTSARPTWTTRCGASTRPHATARPLSIGLLGNAAEVLPELVAARRPRRRRHRPDLGPRSAERLHPGRADDGAGRGAARLRSG